MAIFLLPDFLRIYDMPNFLIGVVKQLLIYLTSFEYCENYLKEEKLDILEIFKIVWFLWILRFIMIKKTNKQKILFYRIDICCQQEMSTGNFCFKLCMNSTLDCCILWNLFEIMHLTHIFGFRSKLLAT